MAEVDAEMGKKRKSGSRRRGVGDRLQVPWVIRQLLRSPAVGGSLKFARALRIVIFLAPPWVNDLMKATCGWSVGEVVVNIVPAQEAPHST